MRNKAWQDGDLMCRKTHESNLFSFRLSAAIARKNDTDDPEQWVMLLCTCSVGAFIARWDIV